MFKSFYILKAYYKLSKLSFGILLLEFILLLIPSLLSIITPILTANLISLITVYDFNKAKLMLFLDFLIIIGSSFLYFIYHFVSSNISKKILFNTTEFIYENIKQNKTINKVTSSTMTDIWTFSNFNNSFLYKICFLIKSIIILIIILYHNFLISISLVIISIISALLLSITNKQIQKNTITLTKSKTKSLELFNSIQKGIGFDTTSYMENTMKYKYFEIIDDCSKTNDKISLMYSLNNNFITLILKSAVFLFSFYLISQVKSTYLSLSTFLILIPYLTSSAQNLIAFFDIFSEIALVDNIIIQFNSFGDIKKNKIQISNSIPKKYDIQFFHVSLNSEDYSISDLSLTISYKSIIQFVGNSSCGKRAIFDILSKKSNVDSGSIFIDEINLNNISNDEYSKIFYCTYKEPYFYNLSILENLLIVCKNKSKVESTLKEYQIYNMINLLPAKIDTIIDENFSQKLLFLLGIIRAILSSPKIICIYEIPQFEESDYKLFFDIIKKINKDSTIILFLHEELKISRSTIYYIENSKLKK